MIDISAPTRRKGATLTGIMQRKKKESEQESQRRLLDDASSVIDDILHEVVAGKELLRRPTLTNMNAAEWGIDAEVG